MPEFVAGLTLCGRFYEQAVQPILAAEWPALPYAAVLIGPGSEVLGYDTERSSDHDWGPRMLLFLVEGDHAAYADGIVEVLRQRLPVTFMGFPTHFGPPDAEGVRVAETRSSGPVEHRVAVHTVRGYFTAQLGLDPLEPLAPADWLALPEQRLLEVTAGRVYHDDVGELTQARAAVAYYPHDLWLYRLAAQRTRIAQQEAFVGRTGEVGDEIGSRLVTAALVRDLMLLCFLMERRYAPYSKWFGTAFATLACARRLEPLLLRVLQATNWQERQAHLSRAYKKVVRLHNALGITALQRAIVSPYFNRPFLVVHADRIAEAIRTAIRDPEVRALPAAIGAVDQFADSTDVLTYPAIYRKLRVLYE